MKRCPIIVVQPVARIEGQELYFGAFGQFGRLVNHEPASPDTRLNRHETRLPLRRAAQQALAADGAWPHHEAPRLKRKRYSR